MKQMLLLSVILGLLLISTSGVFAQEIPFITTWNIDESDKSLDITTTGTGYDYTIDWGDGIIDTAQTGDAIHTYDNAGTYSVSITGDFPRIYLYDSDSAEKLISIDQWGDIQWSSMAYAFYGASNMNILATDAPDLSSVTNIGYMFYLADSFNGDISNWDVSNVTDMHGLFSGASSFNGDISNWDVSNVTDMHGLFSGASSFNGDISNWDVSNVTLMSFVFSSADSFNGDISNWDVSNVSEMQDMFTSAHSFNGDLSNWDVSNVTNMYQMFYLADSFNGDISNWDVSNVTDMGYMFYLADSFNGDISNWDVSNVTDMYLMLRSAYSFSTSNYDKLLDNWSQLTLQNDVIFDSSSKYCDAGEIGRNILIDTYGWVIADSGKDTEENCSFNTDTPIIQWIKFPITNVIPLAAACDDVTEYGRAILGVQGSIENTLFICTGAGWITK